MVDLEVQVGAWPGTEDDQDAAALPGPCSELMAHVLAAGGRGSGYDQVDRMQQRGDYPCPLCSGMPAAATHRSAWVMPAARASASRRDPLTVTTVPRCSPPCGMSWANGGSTGRSRSAARVVGWTRRARRMCSSRRASALRKKLMLAIIEHSFDALQVE